MMQANISRSPRPRARVEPQWLSQWPYPGGTAQMIDVSDLYWRLLQALSTSVAAALDAVLPKFMPKIVMLVVPEVGALGADTKVESGESYENAAVCVPTFRPTVTATVCSPPTPGSTRQVTAVSEIHSAKRQPLSPITTAGFESEGPKLRPWMVMPPPPDTGLLLMISQDDTGASYVNTTVRVPMTAPIETATSSPVLAPVAAEKPLLMTPVSAVAVTHTLVAQVVSPTRMVGFWSDPKFVPNTCATDRRRPLSLPFRCL